MLVDSHHVRYLLRLGELARGKTAKELAARKQAAESFLSTLWWTATPAARQAFGARMEKAAADERPWAAVRVPGPGMQLALGGASGPPAALLLLGRADDDPDDAAGEARLTDAHAPLLEALERWDVPEIQRWLGPLGWQVPSAAIPKQDPLGETAESVPASTPPAADPVPPTLEDQSGLWLRAVGLTAAIGAGGTLLYVLGRTFRAKEESL